MKLLRVGLLIALLSIFWILVQAGEAEPRLELRPEPDWKILVEPGILIMSRTVVFPPAPMPREGFLRLLPEGVELPTAWVEF